MHLLFFGGEGCWALYLSLGAYSLVLLTGLALICSWAVNSRINMVYRLSIIGQLLLILWGVHEPTHWFIVWPVPSRKTWFARCRLVLFWTHFIVYEVTNAKTVITQKGINWWVIEREYEVGWNLFKYHIVWFLELTSGINYCTKEFESIWSAMFKFWHVTNSLPALNGWSSIQWVVGLSDFPYFLEIAIVRR